MISLKPIIKALILIVCLIPFKNAKAQKTNGHIPFYATLYYNYDPLTITIGKYKKELLTKDTTELMNLASKIKSEINNTDVESLYFLSIRLYDLGKKDDAFYWFQTAKSRARIFITMLDPKKIGSIGSEPFELKQLFLTMNQIVGEYMNGYGLNDIDKGISVFEKVRSEVKDIQSYKEVYKNMSFLDESVGSPFLVLIKSRIFSCFNQSYWV